MLKLLMLNLFYGIISCCHVVFSHLRYLILFIFASLGNLGHGKRIGLASILAKITPNRTTPTSSSSTLSFYRFGLRAVLQRHAL